MNLVLLLTGLLLGNSTNNIDVEIGEVEQVSPEDLAYQQQWKEYKRDYEKTYDSSKEDLRRMEIFKENSKMIEEHNDLYKRGFYTYELGHNQFSDLTHQEYLDKYINYNEENNKEHDGPTVKYDKDITVKADEGITVKYPYHHRNQIEFEHNPEITVKSVDPTVKYDEQKSAEKRIDEFTFMPPANVDLPLSVDWRSLGAVTPVKNEGHCAASWAFSATGALEGQLFRRTHHLVSLSEQNLVDCSSKYGNHGCKGGTAANAYRYVMVNGGIATNRTYPWKGKHAWFCRYKRFAGNPKIHGIVSIPSGNETSLMAAVATTGPVAVAVDGRSNKFKFYRNGIFHDPSCSTHVSNREMVVVGYGRSFWIVKNSWGLKWGARGYIYMAKNWRNQCGIATRAIYPVV